MRSVFDEEEIEPSRERTDTELTLGSGTLLAIFFGLVLLCGLCFGMGYAIGHRGSGPTAITPPQPATEQEPLQGNGSIPKPSAMAQTPVASVPGSDAANPTAGTGEPLGATASAAAPTAPATADGQRGTNPMPQVHPAMAATSTPGSGPYASAQAVHPALAQQSIMVQIAAVSNSEDAEVLVNALRQRNYPVTARRDPGDNFIHVRLGPFASRAIAEQWKAKLLNDGYNAVIQP